MPVSPREITNRTSIQTRNILAAYQTSATSTTSSTEYRYNDMWRWFDIRDALDEAARQRQRVIWFAPRKVRNIAPVPHARRYCKIFCGHSFPIGRKK